LSFFNIKIASTISLCLFASFGCLFQHSGL
jgi:hypothetical protein